MTFLETLIHTKLVTQGYRNDTEKLNASDRGIALMYIKNKLLCFSFARFWKALLEGAVMGSVLRQTHPGFS